MDSPAERRERAGATADGDAGLARLSMVGYTASAVGLLLLLVVPYLAIPSTGVRVYYSWAAPGPFAIGLLATAAVAAVAMRAGGFVARETLAGLIVVVGVALLFVSTLWALLVPPQVVMGLPTARELVYHRWLVVVLAAVALGSAVWYASLVRPVGSEEPRSG